MRVRQDARNRYSFDEGFFTSSGHLELNDIRSAHLFAGAYNAPKSDDQQISPALLSAACIFHEIMHFAIDRFVEEQDPGLFSRVLADAESAVGSDHVSRALEAFTRSFPDDAMTRSSIPAAEYLNDETEGTSNRQLALGEMLICRLTNENPAYEPFNELVRDDDLRASSRYEAVVDRFRNAESDGPVGPSGRTLVDLLLEPVRRAPRSLRDQLTFMAGGTWGLSLPERLTARALLGSDLIVEEERAMAARAFAPGPPPPPPVPDFAEQPEDERFSPDVDWMPRVVMVAKNAYVWLDQLTKKHGRTISRLDEIPEAEIEQLAEWGFTALWLIGIWERSEASEKLKHRMGNPDAAASAYSLYDYVVANDLGGTSAVTGLRMVCQLHGIRLCSDMVPNHTGLDSRWVTEHPDWFVQVSQPPYPSYSYTSESLTGDSTVILQVEDGYYDRSDAAVTFRRFDTRTHDERFIYHGNDGTSMPWNDTAQLDFTKAEVREAVIQTILHVARQFPIIRFDAAMVLTQKHFRRLWYPTPGSGGGVPSRAEHGLSKKEFDRRMPVEFWREVVDRIAEEVPDTLLLAEAFWLLEGYFVRTLGMHRVYNSAFMHMLKDEDNAKYRDVMKNTLAFEPEILKRYVNFMSNPDEETACEQFGDGDKFFGVSTLLVTLPGLPMFGHGQVEGFAEKYGMEFRRAYRDETVRREQVKRFERQITPLMRKRYLFAEVENFCLFDFELASGEINQNVFAYTNRRQNERALVVYNNRFDRTAGRIRNSTWLENSPTPVSLGVALGLDVDQGIVVTFKDVITGLEYVVPVARLDGDGLSLDLFGYQHHVFVEFEVLEDDDHSLAALAEQLDGRGVDSLDDAKDVLRLKPVESLLADVLNGILDSPEDDEVDADRLEHAASRLELTPRELSTAMERLKLEVRHVLRLAHVGEDFKWNRSKRYRKAVDIIQRNAIAGSPVFGVMAATLCLRLLEELGVKTSHRTVGSALVDAGLASSGATGDIDVIIPLAGAFSEALGADGDDELLSLILDRSLFGEAFLVNEFAGKVYYNKERFEMGLETAFCLDVFQLVCAENEPIEVDREEAAGAGEESTTQGRTPELETARAIANRFDVVKTLRTAHETSQYDWSKLENR